MIREAIVENCGDRHGIVTRISTRIGLCSESPRQGVRQAEIDGYVRSGLTTDERRRLAELEKQIMKTIWYATPSGKTVDDRLG